MLDAHSLEGLPEDTLAALARFAEAEHPGLVPDDPMSEAGRKALGYYFARMLKQENDIAKPELEEAVHDMRVATRRMRSTLQLFDGFFCNTRRYSKTLRKIADALGAVRDLEVFKQNADHYVAEHPDQNLDPLLLNWEAQIESARTELLALVDSGKYRQFVVDFAEFVTVPGNHAEVIPDKDEPPIPYLARHVAPRLIYEKYSTVRAYETVLPDVPLDTLHGLRIESKQLRYTLETFEEIMSKDAKEVINEVKALQDHLGNLQDARVACVMIRQFVAAAGEQEQMVGVLGYLTQRENEKQILLEGLNAAWESFTRPVIRRSLALSIAGL